MFSSLPPVPALARRARRPLVGLVAVVAVASIGTATVPGLMSVADSDLPVSPGDRVLQAVNVEVGSDGALTAVQGTTVISSADGTQADSTSLPYAPQDVVDDLPVRVRTSYRTEDGSGTDLSDLEGYTGRVQIDLSLENLTTRTEQLSYDVAGASRTRPAVVGAPMTISAAADLGKTDPASVITQRAGEDDVTNGVLSQGPGGITQVQWATILAPPQLSPTATLSLVLDAEDFTTPAFDLSVQPGLVTDPSVGALVENAFNPLGSQEMKLQADTIETIGQVNDVLAGAGDSITEVRTSLSSSTRTLGTKTVSDLESGVVQIATSMRSLDGTVQGLGQQISSTLESTGSSSLAQLQQTVDSIDALLGDTSREPGTARVVGNGCHTTVRAAAAQGSVYDSLLQVAANLRGYAEASGRCESAVRNALAISLGPDADDVDEQCQPSTTPGRTNPYVDSVTCSLADTRGKFTKVAEDIRGSSTAVLAELDKAKIPDAVSKIEALQNQLDVTVTAITTIKDGLPAGGGAVLDLGDVSRAVRELDRRRHELDAAIGSLRSVAEDGRSNDVALAGQLCALVTDSDPVEPGSLSRATVEELRASLTDVTCEDADAGAAVTSPGWDQVLTMTDVGRSDTVFGAVLSDLDSTYAELSDAVDTAVQVSSGSTPGTVKQRLSDLFKTLPELEDQRTSVRLAAGKLATAESDTRAEITSSIASAADDAEKAGQGAVDPAIRQVSEKAEAADADVRDAFVASQQGLQRSAGDIVGSGRRTIAQQRGTLAKTSRGAEGAIESNVRQGLGVISQTVSASTRDADAAGKLLRADLTKVLLDLGDPQVEGSGLLGTLSANAGGARAADFQLARATSAASSYANARAQDIGGIKLRQAQAEAAFKRQAQLPAFQVTVPDGVEHRTIYTFHLAAGQ